MYQIYGIISLISYILCLYQMWHLCQYGDLRGHLPMLMFGALVFLVGGVLLFATRKREKAVAEREGNKLVFWIEMIILVAGTLYFGGRIIYSAIPYNGYLSWKVDEWRNRKTVALEHDNFFEDGVEGILEDLDAKLKLPEELYVANEFRVSFDGTGEIREIYALLYGKDEDQDTRTYLIDYRSGEGGKMTVWVDGEANGSYEKDMLLDPMLEILGRVPFQNQVEGWADSYGASEYEVLYMGRRSFLSAEGLQYVSGDVDGDGVSINGNDVMARLQSGGAVIGYEVSLHIPDMEEVTPVRYMMEPEYISSEELAKEREEQQIEETKETEGWTVDASDGSMYFFLDEQTGWRLKVENAAAGTRYYGLEKTEDGGSSWQSCNDSPFGANGGVAEGLIFFDQNLGFAGLSGASQSASRLYRTEDGGTTFTEVALPVDTVTELPAHAEEWGLTLSDYDYVEMPEEKDGKLAVCVLTQAGETEGLLFESADSGATWIFAGTTAD